MNKSERSERSRRALAEAEARGEVPDNPQLSEARRRAVAATRAKSDAFARKMRPIFAELEAQGIVTYYALDQRFRSSNHIRRPYRVCKSRCERQGPG